jgi:hypothetical protein
MAGLIDLHTAGVTVDPVSPTMPAKKAFSDILILKIQFIDDNENGPV